MVIVHEVIHAFPDLEIGDQISYLFRGEIKFGNAISTYPKANNFLL